MDLRAGATGVHTHTGLARSCCIVHQPGLILVSVQMSRVASHVPEPGGACACASRKSSPAATNLAPMPRPSTLPSSTMTRERRSLHVACVLCTCAESSSHGGVHTRLNVWTSGQSELHIQACEKAVCDRKASPKHVTAHCPHGRICRSDRDPEAAGASWRTCEAVPVDVDSILAPHGS